MANLLADSAYDAWQLIKHRKDLHDQVAMGADGTPTSRADRSLENAMLGVAKQLGINILSEEAGFVDNGSDLVAVIDPLDGTRNAGRGIPIYCTSVAVGKNDLTDIRAGVVRSLVDGSRYAAEHGKGATVNGLPVEPRRFDPSEIMVAIIADHSSQEITHAQANPGHHMRDLGSAAIEMCLVGTGALDAFVARDPWLRVVDVAAATLFVREAGGKVLDPSTGGDLATPYNIDVRTGVLAAHNNDALEAVS